MELRDRILAGVSTMAPDGETVESVDVSALVHRLVLFEQVVLESTRLKEIPALVATFGADGLRELLQSGAMKIVCEAITVGSTGQLAILESRQEKGVLPLGSYSFNLIQSGDRKDYLHHCLQEVHKSSLRHHEVVRLKRDLVPHILDPLEPVNVEEELIGDAVGRPVVLASAIQIAAGEQGFEAPPATELQLDVHQIDDEDIRVDSNLQPLLNVGIDEEHAIVQRALLGIGGLNLRIESMRQREGVIAFSDRDRAFFDQKLSFLLQEVDPGVRERRFDRVLGIAELPTVEVGSTVDVDHVLDLRASSECQEFRAWLRDADGLSDEDVAALLPHIRDRIGALARSGPGRAVRFLASSGIGLLAGDSTGITAGAIDAFLIERLLPTPGPMAWLAMNYPSIFDENRSA